MSVTWVPWVAVPAVPELVHQPTLTWVEGVLLVLFAIAVFTFVMPLARALWPWAKPKEPTEARGRASVIAFVAIPVLAFLAWWVDGEVDDHYRDLRYERWDAVDVIAEQALADVEAHYDLVATEETRDGGLSSLIDTDSIMARDEEATFLEPDGAEVLCLMTLSPPDEGREITLECPSPLEPKDPSEPPSVFPPLADDS